MNKYLIMAIAAGVIIALGSYLIKKTVDELVDNAYDSGYAKAKQENAENIIRQGNENEKVDLKPFWEIIFFVCPNQPNHSSLPP